MCTVEQRYSAFERHLLAFYKAVTHFRHMVDARYYAIFTDHEPLAYAFRHRRDKCSPRQFNNLDLISQFTTDIRNTSGQDNVVVDALSRVKAAGMSLSPKLWHKRKTPTQNSPPFWKGPLPCA